jgi:hypothetical protein
MAVPTCIPIFLFLHTLVYRALATRISPVYFFLNLVPFKDIVNVL